MSARRSTTPARPRRRPSGPAASARRHGSGTSPRSGRGTRSFAAQRPGRRPSGRSSWRQRVGSPWLEAFGPVGGVMFLLRGRGRIPDLLRTGEETASKFGRAIRVDYLADAATLLAQRGEADAALATVADVIAIAQELGYKAYVSQWINGAVLIDAGRPAEAIEPLELAATNAGEVGDVGSASSIFGAPRPRPRPDGPRGRGGTPKRGGAGAVCGPPTVGRRSSGAAPPCASLAAGPAGRSPSARRRAGRHPGRHRLPGHRVPRPPRRGRRVPGGRRREAAERCCAARSPTATSVRRPGRPSRSGRARAGQRLTPTAAHAGR